MRLGGLTISAAGLAGVLAGVGAASRAGVKSSGDGSGCGGGCHRDAAGFRTGVERMRRTRASRGSMLAASWRDARPSTALLLTEASSDDFGKPPNATADIQGVLPRIDKKRRVRGLEKKAWLAVLQGGVWRRILVLKVEGYLRAEGDEPDRGFDADLVRKLLVFYCGPRHPGC